MHACHNRQPSKIDQRPGISRRESCCFSLLCTAARAQWLLHTLPRHGRQVSFERGVVGQNPQHNLPLPLPELQELQELLKSAKTPGVIAILQREIAVRSAPAPEPAPAPAAAVATAVASAASVRHPHDECFGLVSYDHKHTERASMQSTPSYEHIKWGWDSGTKFVNVYCTVPGLKSSDKDKVQRVPCRRAQA